MRIYVVGTGGLGGFFGGLLARAGMDVTFLARGEHYEAMKNRGLTVKSVIGDFQIKPARVVRSIAEIEEPGLILFAVKTYDTAEVAKQFANIVNKSTIIISFQNSVENDIEIKKYVKDAKVFPGLAFVASTRTAPGVIEQTGGARKLIFGDRESSSNEDLKKIQNIMLEAGIDAAVSDNITRDLWEKFIFICAFSGMTAICRSTIGEVLSDALARRSYEDCVREAIAVAKASGIDIPEAAFERVMQISQAFAPNSKSSLLVDVENGRKNEIETLNGALVRLGQSYKVSVPINQLIYSGIRLIS
jgi:2-dehydropantoate 2-reductase